jgi:hypothetical protein
VDRSHRLVMRSNGVTRAARFADAVSARHAGDPGAWLRCAVGAGGVARVLLRRPRVVASGARSRFTIAPRIELRIATGSRTGHTSPADRGSGRRERELPRTVSAPSAAPILLRASARAMRDDGRAAEPSVRARGVVAPALLVNAGATPTGAGPATPARVLRRRPPAVVPVPAPMEAAPSVRPGVQQPRTVSLSPIEINRLTDHIVQTIDRRIVAFRERQGRV